MPFIGYEMCNDPFAYPWAAVHEIMHTFAFGHGDVMRSVVDPSGALPHRERWPIVDRPDAVPSIAKIVPTETDDKTKAEKKKHKKR